jgi:hypothetical protein
MMASGITAICGMTGPFASQLRGWPLYERSWLVCAECRRGGDQVAISAVLLICLATSTQPAHPHETFELGWQRMVGLAIT